MNAISEFSKILKENRCGKAVGIYSICSAHSVVLEAGMAQAIEDNSMVLIESTSNQVNQFGGYTGMKPKDFVIYVKSIAKSIDFPEDRILFGGDHLGPNSWQDLSSSEAMKHSRELIKSYVEAGYIKIHLDTSMFCADDKGDRHAPLDDKIVAARASELCLVAEETWKANFKTPSKLLYVIGTEVPIPGGSQEKEETIKPTQPNDVKQTIDITHSAFIEKGLVDAWKRVVGVVVQPGVEFGDDQVFDYNHDAAKELSQAIKGYDGLLYEAHSTDYQLESSLTALVEDSFAILKVGPWLTFAYREALFGLELIEKEMIGSNPELTLSELSKTLEDVMMMNPKNWAKYYPGNPEEQRLKRKFSFSDRSRYYWPDPKLTIAVDKLISNLETTGIPISLLSQFMPEQYKNVCSGSINNSPNNIIRNRVQEVMAIYTRSCNLGTNI